MQNNQEEIKKKDTPKIGDLAIFLDEELGIMVRTKRGITAVKILDNSLELNVVRNSEKKTHVLEKNGNGYNYYLSEYFKSLKISRKEAVIIN